MTLRTVAVLAVPLALASPVLPQTQDPSAPAAAGGVTSFEDVSARATRAREAGRLGQAASLYREAVGLQPAWAEGWWFLGSMAYERDRHGECRDAFAQLLEIDPQIGPAWALRGLCEFGLRDYPAAQQHFDRAFEVGPVADDPMWWVVIYHHVLLLLKDGEFERAIEPLRQLAARPDPALELVEACGLRLLRRAHLPADIPAASRELVRAAGRAECAALASRREEAEKHFLALLERYPRERHVHYGHGLLLAQGGSAGAIEAFRREIQLHPDHVPAHVELAFQLLNHGRPEEAVRAAETAVRLDSEVFVTHLALGRALVASGDLTLGTFELESAARLAPGSPDVQFALARAYARAGRREDADRANARFRELEQARQGGEVP